MYTHFIEVGDDPIWLTGTDTERDTPPEGGVAKKEINSMKQNNEMLTG